MNKEARTFEEHLKIVYGSLVALLAVPGAIITALKAFSKEIEGASLIFEAVCLAVLLYAGVRWLHEGISLRSRLRRPDQLRLQPALPRHLSGRGTEIADLKEQCLGHSISHLSGTSGVGKTSLVLAGLLPGLKGTPFLPCYIDCWAQDWEAGLQERVIVGMLESLATLQLEAQQKEKLDICANGRDMVALLRGCKDRLGLTPLIIFDQFDDYQLKHHRRLFHTSHPYSGGALDSEATLGEATLGEAELAIQSPSPPYTVCLLTESNSFWQQISALVNEHTIHILTVARQESRAWMQFLDSKALPTLSLDRVPYKNIRSLLDELEQTKDEFPVISNPKGGWEELKDELVKDLTRQSRVLPVQASLALRGIAGLPALTVSQYKFAGRLRGLEASTIHQIIVQTSERAGVSSVMVKRALESLVIEREIEGVMTLKSVSRTRAELAEAMSFQAAMPITRPQLQQCMETLAREQLVRCQFVEGYDQPLWLLDHDYLCLGVMEAEENIHRWSLVLKERFFAFQKLLQEQEREQAPSPNSPRQWGERLRWQWKRLQARWRHLLRPSIWLALLFQKLVHRFQGPRGVPVRDINRYMAWSGLRLTAPAIKSLFLLYLVMAELNVPVVGGRTLRIASYSQGISFFPFNPAHVNIQQNTKQLRGQLLTELRRRHVYGWYQPQWYSPHHVISAKDVSHEPWVQGQAITAILRAPEATPADLDDAYITLNSLYAHRQNSTSHVPYGWLTFATAHQTTAEPVLWTIAATAILQRQVPIEKARRLDEILRYAQQAARQYHPLSAREEDRGSWNMYPNQLHASYHSTYTATLALLTLLELKEAEVGWYENASDDDDKALRRRDQMISQTAHWLEQHYDVKAGGWKPSNQSSATESVQPGLTFQVFSVLLRADQAGAFKIKPEILHWIPRALSQTVDLTDGPAPNKMDAHWGIIAFNQRIKTHQGKTMDGKIDIHFLWYPWAIETAERWIHLQTDTEEKSWWGNWWDKRTVLYARDRMITAWGQDTTALFNQNLTFVPAELLYCLNSFEDTARGTNFIPHSPSKTPGAMMRPALSDRTHLRASRPSAPRPTPVSSRR